MFLEDTGSSSLNIVLLRCTQEKDLIDKNMFCAAEASQKFHYSLLGPSKILLW